jgi:hypothetical protein
MQKYTSAVFPITKTIFNAIQFKIRVITCTYVRFKKNLNIEGARKSHCDSKKRMLQKNNWQRITWQDCCDVKLFQNIFL